MNTQAAKAYSTTDVMTSDPYKLILMLYDGALKHLFQARKAILEKDTAGKGEHISKVIGIVGELLSSVQGDPEDEAVNFLRGLYSAILAELPKANINNDVKVIELSIKYMAQLRNIWKEHVMASQKALQTDIENKRQADNRAVVNELQHHTQHAGNAAKIAAMGAGAYAKNFSCRL